MKTIKEKKERSLGVKLFIKAERCSSPKCAMVRHPYRPGMHGQKHRRAISDYGRQLQEKQKAQLLYGFNGRQMQNLFKRSSREEILLRLETRLDHVVFLLGFAKSPRIARQFVSHGHILVNGRKVTIPSYRVRIGDIIRIRPESREGKLFEDIHPRLKEYVAPSWLELLPEKLEGKCVSNPPVESMQLPFDVNLVVQFFAR